MRIILPLLLSLFNAIAAPIAGAQDVRPLRIVVGYAPGGSLDTIARLMAAEMARGLGRPVIVDNRPGANGNIAAEQVARGPADGNTMLMTFNTHPLLGALYPHLPFDPVADFRAVGLVASTPYLLAANPKLPGANLAEALERARAAGRTLSYATVGPGSPQHLTAVRMQQAANLPITIVHYKGGAPAQNDVLAGHVDMMLVTVALGLPQVKAGRLKVLAVSTAQRLSAVPAAPTFIESGLKGQVSEGWFGFLLPAKTPAAIVTRYNHEINRSLAVAATRDSLKAIGTVPLGGSPERMESLMREEQKLWSKIIVDNDIKPEQ